MTDEKKEDLNYLLEDDDKKALAKAFLDNKILYSASAYVDNTGLA